MMTTTATCDFCHADPHDPVCPVATGAVSTIRELAATPSDNNEAPPAAPSFVAVDPTQPHRFVAEPFGEGEEPADQCVYCSQPRANALHPDELQDAPAEDPAEPAEPIGTVAQILRGDRTVVVVALANGEFVRGVLRPDVDVAPDAQVYAENFDGAVEPISGAAAAELRTTVDGHDAVVRKPRSQPIIPQKTMVEAMAEASTAAERLEEAKNAEAAIAAQHNEAKERVKAAESQLRQAYSVALEAYRRENGDGSAGAQLVLGEDA